MRIIAIGFLVVMLSSASALAQTAAPAAAPAPVAQPQQTPAPIEIPVVHQTSEQAPATVEVAPSEEPNALVAFLHRMYQKLTFVHADDPDPSGTLVAPFAYSTAKPVVAGEGISARLATNSVPIDQPHRSGDDLGGWLSQAMAETLNFSADTYADHMKLMSKGTDATGLAQFNTWVTSSGILSTLQTNGLQMNGYVQEKPFLLNEGAVNGRYRWLFEVPVLISFVPRGTTSLDKQNGVDSRKLIINVQIGRVEHSEIPDGIMIESWSVQDDTRKN